MTDTQAKTTDFCWLIERSQPEGIYPPEYWVKWRVWTTDATKATRFYDGEPDGCPPELQGRARAQDIANGLHPLPPGMRDKPYCRVVEHGFMSRPADSALTSDPTPFETLGELDAMQAESQHRVDTRSYVALMPEEFLRLLATARAFLSRPSDPTDGERLRFGLQNRPHYDAENVPARPIGWAWCATDLDTNQVVATCPSKQRAQQVVDALNASAAFLSRSETPVDVPTRSEVDATIRELERECEAYTLGKESKILGVSARLTVMLNVLFAAVLQRAPAPQNMVTGEPLTLEDAVADVKRLCDMNNELSAKLAALEGAAPLREEADTDDTLNTILGVLHGPHAEAESVLAGGALQNVRFMLKQLLARRAARSEAGPNDR